MQTINIVRGQGGIPKTLPGEDHISGFLMYLPEDDFLTLSPSSEASEAIRTNGFTASNRIIGVSTLEMAESLGITNESSSWHIKALHYHLSEVFRINPSIILYLGLFNTSESAYDYREVKQMQNFAEGKLRQLAVYNPSKEISGTDVIALQGTATLLESEDAPLSILYAGKVSNLTSFTNFSGSNQKNVSVIISQDGAGVAAALYKETGNTTRNSVSTIGNALGIVSTATVNESIAWVKKFPSGISLPAFCDGTLLRELDKSVIQDLDTKRFLFLSTYSGLAGAFYNDSHTMDSAISDYAMIESVRTMDKAVRGIRAYILPELGRPLNIDPNTGSLDPSTIAHLELTANKTLEQMERMGELSGYKVEINPSQNVLASSCVEFVIKQIPVGIMRRVVIKIGFTNKI